MNWKDNSAVHGVEKIKRIGILAKAPVYRIS